MNRRINHINTWLDEVYLIGTYIPYDAIVEIKDLFIKIVEVYYKNLTVYSFPNYYFIMSKMLVCQKYLDRFPDRFKVKKNKYESWTLIVDNMDPNFFRENFIN